jgi:hypothetical protein
MRQQTGFAFLSALAVAGLWGCQKDQTAVEKKLDDIDKRLAGIEKAIREGGGRPGAGRPMPQQQGPDPSKTYSVPIAGAPFKGVDNAKITVVEAFEFA